MFICQLQLAINRAVASVLYIYCVLNIYILYTEAKKFLPWQSFHIELSK